MQGRQEYQSELFATIDIESMIPKNHLLRKLDRLLDLSFVREMTKDFYCENNGRPSVDPELFLRMLLISYFYGIDSDRRLCEEVQFNLAYRWYCKLSLTNKVPDHSSLTKIRDRLGEDTFKNLFIKVLEMCKEKGLVKSESVMADASLVKADAALDSLRKRDGKDDNDRPTFLKGQKYSNQLHRSTSDPDASLANKAGVHKALYHKVHQMSDSESRVIVDTHVTTGAVHETTMLATRVEAVENNNIKVKEVIADRGYGSAENINYLEAKNIDPVISLWSSRSGETFFEELKEGFRINESTHEIFCPEDHLMKYSCRDHKTGRDIYVLPRKTCLACPRKSSCMTEYELKKRSKRFIVPDHYKLYAKVLEREKMPEFRNKLWQRMWKVEGLFAEGKNFHLLDRAKYRGRSKMQIQAYLVASVQNLKRLMEVVIDLLIAILRKLILMQLELQKI